MTIDSHETLYRLTRLFNQIEPTTPEEVDQELRASGLDPEAVGARMAEVAQRMLVELPCFAPSPVAPLGPLASTCCSVESESLSLETLQQTIDDLTEEVYYATSDYLEPGEALILPERRYTHRMIVCHPDELEYVRQNLGPLTKLVPIEDAEPKLPPIVPGPEKLWR